MIRNPSGKCLPPGDGPPQGLGLPVVRMRRGERPQFAGSEVDDAGTRRKHSEDEMISRMRAPRRVELVVLFA